MNHGANPFFFCNNNSNPQSELTYVSKKRIRDESLTMNGFFKPNPNPIVSDQSEASTSGGRSRSSSPIANDLAIYFYQQSTEIDALIRLQNERLQLELDQIQKHHCRSLISTIEQQVIKKLTEMEMELEIASQRNAELEYKVRQISAGNQIWFNVAKNNEAIVSSLKSSLEQVLLQNCTVNAVKSKEGYGDSEGMAFPADDAQSRCFEREVERINGAVKIETETAVIKCKVCCEKHVDVLLLPCKHLCLCKDCEAKVDTCPVCHVTKNASLQIFMS